MDTREAIEKAKAHMLAQKAAAVDGTSCVYLAADGNTCGVGCLLSTETAKLLTAAGAGSIRQVLRDFKQAAQELAGVDVAALSELQRIHDARRDEETGERLLGRPWPKLRSDVAKTVIARECDELLAMYY